MKKQNETKNEAKEITLYLEKKHVNFDGKEFDVFKTPIGKLNVDVKFQKEAELPTESGYYVFESDKVNLNTKGDYPVIWIRK